MAESPTGPLVEQVQEHAHATSIGWIAGAALTAALLAVLATLAGSQAGTELTAATRSQIQSNDQWGFFQAKSIKSAVMRAKMELLTAMNHTPAATDKTKLDEYEHDLESLKTQAENDQKASEFHLHQHESLEHAALLFQIAIAVVAISVLTRRKAFWFASIACGIVGIALGLPWFWGHP